MQILVVDCEWLYITVWGIKYLMEYSKSNGNDLATMRFSVFCDILLSNSLMLIYTNSSTFCIERIKCWKTLFFQKYFPIFFNVT